MLKIRFETGADHKVIDHVLNAAFPSEMESDLVRGLRSSGQLSISLIAELDGKIVGHIAFSPVTTESHSGGLGLAPMAVMPEYQRQGIGSHLIRNGLAEALKVKAPYVVVLGHPEYYPRFGFRQASTWGLKNEYDADDAFMILELLPGSLPPPGTIIRFGPEFSRFA